MRLPKDPALYLEYLQQNPVMLVGGVVGVGLLVYLWKKGKLGFGGGDTEKEYEEKDWEKIITNKTKDLAERTGYRTNKELWKEDHEKKDDVYMYFTFDMPEDLDYMDWVFGNYDESEVSEDDRKTHYVFVCRNESTTGKLKHKFVENLGRNASRFYVLAEESLQEEQHRFKFGDIDFKHEYSHFFVEKGNGTEGFTDQFPYYQARNNIVEGIEEFSMKTLFLDRKHSSQVAQMREDVDEEALKRLLGQGKDF